MRLTVDLHTIYAQYIKGNYRRQRKQNTSPAGIYYFKSSLTLA